MGQHDLTGHVAACIYVLEVGLHKLVHHDAASVHLQVLQRLQALHVGPATYADEDPVGLIPFAIRLYLFAIYLLHLGFRQDADTGFLVFLL